MISLSVLHVNHLILFPQVLANSLQKSHQTKPCFYKDEQGRVLLQLKGERRRVTQQGDSEGGVDREKEHPSVEGKPASTGPRRALAPW